MSSKHVVNKDLRAEVQQTLDSETDSFILKQESSRVLRGIHERVLMKNIVLL